MIWGCSTQIPQVSLWYFNANTSFWPPQGGDNLGFQLWPVWMCKRQWCINNSLHWHHPQHVTDAPDRAWLVFTCLQCHLLVIRPINSLHRNTYLFLSYLSLVKPLSSFIFGIYQLACCLPIPTSCFLMQCYFSSQPRPVFAFAFSQSILICS